MQCLQGNWSIRQLQRQIGSLWCERTGLSTDKESVIGRAASQDLPPSITTLPRDPYVLEFAGLAERPSYSEADLESALLDHLQAFLLELGTGFCFEARQKPILVDLKIRPFNDRDAGQMNFYLSHFKQKMMATEDNPPVGIILCSDKDQTKVQTASFCPREWVNVNHESSRERKSNGSPLSVLGSSKRAKFYPGVLYAI